MTATNQAMAFYHEDGLVPAWNFAKKYAGNRGHIATLPEIIEARLASGRDDASWNSYFVTSSAEYYGIGADGTEKLIVAHGVGPMSTLEGIKRAYSWEYRDKSRHNNGGRITAEEFLKLEAGEYGEVQAFTGSVPISCDIQVVDLMRYLDSWDDAFYGWRSPITALFDLVLRARLGPNAREYVEAHAKLAQEWHKSRHVKLPDDGRPMIINVRGASNCSYDTSPHVNGRFDWSKRIPRPLEPGQAIAHLLGTQGLVHIHTGGWQGLTTEFYCHEWNDGVRFVGVRAGAAWQNGIAESPQPYNVLRQQWQRFILPNEDTAYIPPRLHRIEQFGSEWFTRYPKLSDGERMDESDVEFHARSVRPVGAQATFVVDEMFFLRYNVSQVTALAPDDANAYDIVDISRPDSNGLTTVTVQFYDADVDMTGRLPRQKEIKQNYALLMG